jgi:hypothetical protein
MTDLNVAPGSLVKVRDADWLVTNATPTQDGLLVEVTGLSELVRDTRAAFYEHLDETADEITIIENRADIAKPEMGWEAAGGIPLTFAWPEARVTITLDTSDAERAALTAASWLIVDPGTTEDLASQVAAVIGRD